MSNKPIRLADLEKPVGEILLPNGREVSVRPIDGRGEQYRQAIADGTAEAGDLWKFAALLLPDATEEEVLSLTPGAIGIVAQMACGQLDAVLALAAAAELIAGKATAPTPAAPSPSTLTIG